MKKRMLSLALALALFCAMSLPVFAADANGLSEQLEKTTDYLMTYVEEMGGPTYQHDTATLYIARSGVRNDKVDAYLDAYLASLKDALDENGGKLPRRCVFYCDEFGTIPKLEGAEMLFSAARSRRLSIVAIVQGLIQLDKNYGKEGAQIIRDNCQLTIFGGFAPGSETADTLSKDLGEQTVLSGSVSKGKDSNSRSMQMMGRRLMTPDELKSIPKGAFITMKTGMHPMMTQFQLFLRWGISFGKPYTLPEHAARKVEYAGRVELVDAILKRYGDTEAVNIPTDESRTAEEQSEKTARPRVD